MSQPASSDPTTSTHRHGVPSGRTALIVVCVLHAVSPLIAVGLHQGLGWDETVYLSQLNSHVPAGLFSPPRARGLTFLVAPVTLLTTSTLAIRVYLSVLAGLGLYLGLRPWQRLRPGYIVPVAGLLLSSLWMTIFYAYEAMPNEWAAYCVLAASGFGICYLRDPARRRYLGYVAVWVLVMALIRPSDSLYFIVGLVVAVLACRLGGWRPRAEVLLAVIVGAVIGVGQWVVEAFVSYGGPIARYHAASAENGGGLHVAISKQYQALAGPLLCRGSCVAHAPMPDRVWWFAAAVLVVAGLCYGWRRSTLTTTTWLPFLIAVIITLQYIVFIGYAAPRFLIPTYALLALPAAEALGWVWTVRAQWVRPVVLVVVPLAFLAHLAVQVHVLRADIVPQTGRINHRVQGIAGDLRAAGMHDGGLVVGSDAAQIGYAMRSADTPIHRTKVLHKVHIGEQVAVIRNRRAAAGAYYASWRMIRVPGARADHRWFAYLANIP